MAEAWCQNLTIWTIELLLSSITGFGDSEGDRKASEAYEYIMNHHQERWDREAEAQREWLTENVSHLECECGAVIWHPETCEGFCSSCWRTNGDPSEGKTG